MSHHGERRIGDELLEWLGADDPDDQLTAISGLVVRGTTEDVAALRRRFLTCSDDDDPAVVAALAEAAGALTFAGATPRLFELLDLWCGHDIVPDAALAAIGRIRDPSADARLRMLVEDPRFEDHFEEILSVLVDLDGAGLDAFLAAQLDAASPARQIFGLRGVGRRVVTGAASAARRLLGSGDAAVSQAARRALLRLGVDDAAVLLRVGLDSAPDYFVFTQLLRSLRDEEAAEVGPVLLDAAAPTETHRVDLLTAAHRLGYGPAGVALEEAIESGLSPCSAARARLALLRGGRSDQVVELLSFLADNGGVGDDRDAYVAVFGTQSDVVQALQQWVGQDPTHKRELLELLHEIRTEQRPNPPPVRRAAQVAIEELTGTERFSEFARWRVEQGWDEGVVRAPEPQPSPEPRPAPEPTPPETSKKPWWKLW